MSNNSSVKKLLGNRVFISLLILAAVIVAVSAIFNGQTDKTATNTEQQTEKKETNVVIPEKDSADNADMTDELLETMLPADEKQPEKTEQEKTEYKMPLSGELQRAYSSGELVWDETMQDWRTHNGVDIASDDGGEVDTSAPGTVTFAAKDESCGYVVKIDHQNGVTTVYKNLGKIVVKEGDSVDEGQMIGTVGASAAFESAQKPHLHFEVIEDGGYKNPVEFVN